MKLTSHELGLECHVHPYPVGYNHNVMLDTSKVVQLADVFGSNQKFNC